MKLNRPIRPRRPTKGQTYITGNPVTGDRVQFLERNSNRDGSFTIGPGGTRQDSDGDGNYREDAGGIHGSAAQVQYPVRRQKRIKRDAAIRQRR